MYSVLKTHLTIEIEFHLILILRKQNVCARTHQRPTTGWISAKNNNKNGGDDDDDDVGTKQHQQQQQQQNDYLFDASRECAALHLFLKTENNIYVSTSSSLRRARFSFQAKVKHVCTRQCECVSKRKGFGER